MDKWKQEPSEDFKRDFKKYEKKKPNELRAVLINLDRFFNTLNEVNNPFLIKAGYIHCEPKGILAIDQKGASKTKLQETRLYIFCIVEGKTVKLLKIGDKNTQSEDIKKCVKTVSQTKEEKGNE